MIKLRVGKPAPRTTRGMAPLPPRRQTTSAASVVGWMAALMAAAAVAVVAIVTSRPISQAKTQAVRELAQLRAQQQAALAQQQTSLEQLRGEYRALCDQANTRSGPARQLQQQVKAHEHSLAMATARLTVKQDLYQRLRTRCAIPHATLAELVCAYEEADSSRNLAAASPSAPARIVAHGPETPPEVPTVEARPEAQFFAFETSSARDTDGNRGTLKATLRNGNPTEGYQGLKAKVVIYAKHAEEQDEYLVMKVIETTLDLASQATASLADTDFRLHFTYPDPPGKTQPGAAFEYAGFVVLLCTPEGELIKGKPYRSYQQKHLANYLVLKEGDLCSVIGDKQSDEE